jgi:hypothetical protein
VEEVGQFDDIPIRRRIGYGAAMWSEKGESNSRLLSAEGTGVANKHARQSHEAESEAEKEMRPIYSYANSARLRSSNWCAGILQAQHYMEVASNEFVARPTPQLGAGHDYAARQMLRKRAIAISSSRSPMTTPFLSLNLKAVA